MAGKYSRELSTKVYIAQKRLVLDGFRAGSAPGYGLRRAAVSSSGRVRRKLAPGERKPFASDRIVLVPGPRKEVALVRWIYRRFLRAKGKVGPYDIARELNRDCIPAASARPWSPFAVRQVLTNRKYVGALVWGKTTQELRTLPKRKPQSQWVITEDVYEPIVSKLRFERAQALFEKRSDKLVPEQDLIRSLQRTLNKHGHLRKQLMNCRYSGYGLSTYQRRIGSMQRIYDLFGLHYPAGLFRGRAHSEITIRIRNLLVLRILKTFPDELSPFRVPNAARRLNLLLDGRFKVFVWVANYYRTGAGKVGWQLDPAPNETGGLILLCIMKPDNQDYESLYLFPALNLQCTQYKFGKDDAVLKKGLRLANLSQLCWLAREGHIEI